MTHPPTFSQFSLSGEKRPLVPDLNLKSRSTVFDSARAKSRYVAKGGGGLGGHFAIEFRRNERDRHVARQNVTAILMGDPSPDRKKW